MRGMSSARASRAACSGPAPPNATSVLPRGHPPPRRDRPDRVGHGRGDDGNDGLGRRRRVHAERVGQRADRRESRFRCARFMRPPARLPGFSVCSTRLASVTVGPAAGPEPGDQRPAGLPMRPSRRRSPHCGSFPASVPPDFSPASSATWVPAPPMPKLLRSRSNPASLAISCAASGRRARPPGCCRTGRRAASSASRRSGR